MPLWARYTVSVTGQEPLVFALESNNSAVSTFAEFDILEVLLRNKELGINNFIRSFVGVLRTWDVSTDLNGITNITYTAPNEKHILSWRSVLWPAGVANRSEFTAQKAETVMKTLVKYNTTSDATVANGRDRAGNLATNMGVTISIVADAGGGSAMTGSFIGKTLLSALQNVALVGGGDFSLKWQGGSTWSFAFHAGQLGLDKSSGANRVLFSLGTNTMSNPRLVSTPAKATSAISAGQGEGTAREISEVHGPDYVTSNDIETFVDARSESTSAGREYRGNLKLDDMKSRRVLTFDVLQTSNQFYSPIAVAGQKTFTAGDLTLTSYFGDTVRKIDKIFVEWSQSNRFQAKVETIEV